MTDIRDNQQLPCQILDIEVRMQPLDIILSDTLCLSPPTAVGALTQALLWLDSVEQTHSAIAITATQCRKKSLMAFFFRGIERRSELLNLWSFRNAVDSPKPCWQGNLPRLDSLCSCSRMTIASLIVQGSLGGRRLRRCVVFYLWIIVQRLSTSCLA